MSMEKTKKGAKKNPKLFTFLMVGALLLFEVSNYSTTDFALNNLYGSSSFFGIRWTTILALAFCGIDFAGIARLFTPEQGKNEPLAIWYLFGAWLIAITINARLTWWAMTITGAPKLVAIIVALMVWLSRVLIIGTFSVAGDQMFNFKNPPQKNSTRGRPTHITTK